MGMMDEMKDKATDALGKHGDKIDEGLDKTGEMAKDKTGGKHDDKIDQGVERGKDAVRDFGGEPERQDVGGEPERQDFGGEPEP